jgi:hypothetical protein
MSVALDERTAFKVEELADLKLIVSDRVEQVAFDYLTDVRLLRAIPAEAAEFVVLIAKGGGGVTNNFRGKE